jgi:hypothetical protein
MLRTEIRLRARPKGRSGVTVEMHTGVANQSDVFKLYNQLKEMNYEIEVVLLKAGARAHETGDLLWLGALLVG